MFDYQAYSVLYHSYGTVENTALWLCRQPHLYNVHPVPIEAVEERSYFISPWTLNLNSGSRNQASVITAITKRFETFQQQSPSWHHPPGNRFSCFQCSTAQLVKSHIHNNQLNLLHLCLFMEVVYARLVWRLMCYHAILDQFLFSGLLIHISVMMNSRLSRTSEEFYQIDFGIIICWNSCHNCCQILKGYAIRVSVKVWTPFPPWESSLECVTFSMVRQIQGPVWTPGKLPGLGELSQEMGMSKII